MNPLFLPDGDRFVPTSASRGPWDPKFLHGGPPAALLAHLVESANGDPDLFIARMTFDLFRPVGFAPLVGRTSIARDGRRIRVIDAVLETEGTIVARAAALLVRRSDASPANVTLATRDPIPDWRGLPEEHWWDLNPHPEPAFHKGCLLRYVVREWTGKSAMLWVRAPYELFPGQPLTPLQHVAAIADYSNAIGTGSRPTRAPFINADIGLSLFREPKGDWICMQSAGRGDAAGIAVSNVHLHDEGGFFGHSSATCLAN